MTEQQQSPYDWLRGRYLFLPSSNKPVVPHTARSVADGMTVQNFKLAIQNRFRLDSGNTRLLYEDWITNAHKIEGVALRPDQPVGYFPGDHGGSMLNTYRPPVHSARGDGTAVDVWRRFIRHLIPGDQERVWFQKWLAYKVQHPGERMVAVLFLAANIQGTGRGTLFKIVERLMGEDYVRSIGFDLFCGSSSQSVFNEWMEELLVVCIDELSAQSGPGRHLNNRNIYTHIKDIVDPAASAKTVTRKGVTGAKKRVFFSTLMATNDPDAMYLPADDRRFTVIANGDKLKNVPGLAEDIYTVISDQGAIGELYEHFQTMNVSGFDPQQPLETDAKKSMMQTHVTDLESAVMDVIEGFEGKCFTIAQVTAKLRGKISPDLLSGIKNVFTKKAFVVKSGDGRIEVKTGDKSHKLTVYASSYQMAAHWKMKSGPEIKREAEKNGSLIDDPIGHLMAALPPKLLGLPGVTV